MFAALLIIEMLMNCILNQINGTFHNYLSRILVITYHQYTGQIIMKGTINNQ